MRNGGHRVAAALIGLATIGCHGLDQGLEPRNFRLEARAFTVDPVTSRRTECVLTVDFIRSTYGEEPWSDVTQPGTVSVWRSIADANGTNVVFAKRSDDHLRIDITFPAADSVLIILSGTFTDTLRAGREIHAPIPYAGAWRCPASLPLGADSVLTSKGYDATRPITGSWTLEPTAGWHLD